MLFNDDTGKILDGLQKPTWQYDPKVLRGEMNKREQKEWEQKLKTANEIQDKTIEIILDLYNQLEAQRKAHQQQLRELKEELEKKFEPTVPMSIKYEDWHGIWGKYLGGEDETD